MTWRQNEFHFLLNMYFPRPYYMSGLVHSTGNTKWNEAQPPQETSVSIGGFGGHRNQTIKAVSEYVWPQGVSGVLAFHHVWAPRGFSVSTAHLSVGLWSQMPAAEPGFTWVLGILSHAWPVLHILSQLHRVSYSVRGEARAAAGMKCPWDESAALRKGVSKWRW